MSKKNLDCFKLIDKNCISKLENLFASRANEPPKNNTIGSKNIIKNENKVESNSSLNSKNIKIPPAPPLPPPLLKPLSNSQKEEIKNNSDSEKEEVKNNSKINTEKKEINFKNSDKVSTFHNHNYNDNINNLRYRLPLQRKLEELGEVLIDHHIKEVRLREIPIHIPEWFIGLIAGTITTTFFNIFYFKLFG